MKEKVFEIVEKLKNDKKSLVAICIGLVLLIVGAVGVVMILSEYASSDNKQADLEEEYLVSGGEDNLGKIEKNEISWYEFARVDVAALKEKYPEVVGWIMFENEEISYPIMQSDNVKYLTTAYDGSTQKAGSIFMDEFNDSSFTDAHTIIYGHNMQNLSMFGRLKYYKTDDEYFESHKYFQIFTETEILRYEIFFCNDIPVTSYIYQDRTLSAGALGSLMKRESMVDNEISVNDNDRIITLSTCTASEDERFVVSAVLVGTYPLSADEELNQVEEMEE